MIRLLFNLLSLSLHRLIIIEVDLSYPSIIRELYFHKHFCETQRAVKKSLLAEDIRLPLLDTIVKSDSESRDVLIVLSVINLLQEAALECFRCRLQTIVESQVHYKVFEMISLRNWRGRGKGFVSPVTIWHCNFLIISDETLLLKIHAGHFQFKFGFFRLFLFWNGCLCLDFFNFFSDWYFHDNIFLNCFCLFNLFKYFHFFDHWHVCRWSSSISFDWHLYIGFYIVYTVHLSIAFKHTEGCWKHKRFRLLKLASNLLNKGLRAVIASHTLARLCCIHSE